MKRLVIVATLLVVATGTLGCNARRFGLWNNVGDQYNVCDPCGQPVGDGLWGGGGGFMPSSEMSLPPGQMYLPGPAEIITPAP